MGLTSKKRSHFSESSNSAQSKKPKSDPSSTSRSAYDAPRAAPSFTSALQNDEVDFPRGGGTSLTAFEVKQTRDEGRREADAEVKALKPLNQDKKRKISERQAKRLKKNEIKQKEVDTDAFRVEELSYNRLVSGTKVLARVHSILPLHLIVSLPNNLLAHVPITQVSKTLTALLAAEETKAADGNDVDDDEDLNAEIEEEVENTEVPNLAQLFVPGQYFPAKVLTLFPTASQSFISQYPISEMTRLAARVELTLIPDQVNGDIAKTDVVAGYAITAEILSEEDKGWRAGLGLNDAEGWISSEEAEKAGMVLVPGQLVTTTVSAVTAGGRVMQLSLDRQALTGATVSEATVGSLVPGTLVQALITAIVPSGLNLKVCGFFEGSVDLAHLALGDADIGEKYKIGKKIKARILYETIVSSSRRFALSLLPHVLQLTSPVAADKKTPLEVAIPIGKILQSVRVVRVLPDWGLVCRTEDGLEGFAHISHLSDERLPALSAATGQFRAGTYHRARVIGHSPLDGVLLLSFEQKVLDQVFMQVGELSIGQILKGTIRRLSEKGLFINVQGSVDGVVWPNHYADIRLKHPEKRFKVGATVKCRVFALEPERGRVILTLKKSLVESDLTIPQGFESVQPGQVTPAVVSKLLDKGCIVDLFGGLRAFVPQSEASQNYIVNLADIFYVGKPVNVRITDVNESSARIVASVRQALPTALAAEQLDVGSDVAGIVAQIHAEHVAITLVPSQLTALLSLSNLSNHRHMGVDELRATLKVGDRIDDLVVVSKNPTSGLLIVANKRAKKSTTTDTKDITTNGVSAKAQSIKEIVIGQTVPGRVISITPQGTMVQINSQLRGRIHPTDVNDDFSTIDISKPKWKVGDSILCVVVNVNKKHNAIDLSTRKSLLESANGGTSSDSKASIEVVDPVVDTVEDLKPDQAVRGFVFNVADNGLFVSLGRSVTARVMIKEMFDDFVKDWRSRFIVGQLVSGKILSIDHDRSKVEMTLRTRSKSSKKSTIKATLSDFSINQKVSATVKRVEPYGLFLRIDDTQISGICHRSEISDNPKQDVQQAIKGFREGDAVRAVIIGIDLEKGKISFSIKASRFADEFEQEDKEEDEGVTDGEGDIPGLEGEDDDEGEGDENEDDDEDKQMEANDDESDEEEEEEDVNEEDIDTAPAGSSDAQAKSNTAASSTALSVGTGFDWTGSAPLAADEDDDEEDEDEDEDDTTAKPTTLSRSAGKKRALDLTATAPDSQPESASEFERALLASPNSSFLWIQYMSFQLSLHEIEKARQIGRQALERISFREEGEKLNVWMALVNLELGFGTEESSDKVFKEALQFNDARTVFVRYADALQTTGKDGLVEDVYKKMLKRFSAYPDTWAKFAEFYLKKGDTESARALLPRAIQSLDKSKHVEITEKMAVLEFKYGESERGKTLFEGILDRYPKRLDLWNVYVDQVAKTGDIAAVRALVDRALGQKLTMKRAKFIFKKWLSLETRIGDAAGQEKAKTRARDWVAANAKPVEEEEEDGEQQ